MRPSLRYLSEMNEGVLRNLENSWHKIYIGWHAVLGQLKVRQRDDDSKGGFVASVFSKKERVRRFRLALRSVFF